jgi:hypothetical protein
MRNLPLVALAVLAIAVAGCGSSDKKSSTGAQQSGGTPTAPATTPNSSVKFTSPNDGAPVGSTVKATVALKHFVIDPRAVGKAPRPGRGHLHFVMDEGKLDFPKYSGANGLLGKKLGVNGHYSPALAPTITYQHVPPGKHTLEVYLANNNHTNVGVEAEVKFTVR